MKNLEKIIFFPYLITAITFVWCLNWICGNKRVPFIYRELICPKVTNPKVHIVSFTGYDILANLPLENSSSPKEKEKV